MSTSSSARGSLGRRRARRSSSIMTNCVSAARRATAHLPGRRLASTSRSRPMSATTSSAAGCAKPSATAPKMAGRPEGTTLSVGITHPDGERTFFTTRGHLPRLSLADVFAVVDGARISGGYALLCGSFLTDDLTRGLRCSSSTGRMASTALRWRSTPAGRLDGWTETKLQATRGWLSRCGCALLNEVEATTLAGLDDPDRSGPRTQGPYAEGRHRRGQTRARTGPLPSVPMAAGPFARRGQGRRHHRCRRRLQCGLPCGPCRRQAARRTACRRNRMSPRVPFPPSPQLWRTILLPETTR
jgi:hypothetical protein